MDQRLARQLIVTGLGVLYPVPQPVSVAQAVGAVALLETNDGEAWKGAGRGSFNMGADTAGAMWKGATFQYQDSRPDPAHPGHDIVYTTRFRKYPDAEAGFLDLCILVLHSNGRDKLVLPAAQAGDFYGVSAGLYKSGYYTGVAADPTPEARIRRHYGVLYRDVQKIALALGEPAPAFQIELGDVHEPSIPLLVRGSGYAADDHVRDLVRHVQRSLGLAADGLYGPLTEAVVEQFQRHHVDPKDGRPLGVDGKVGPATRRALGWAA